MIDVRNPDYDNTPSSPRRPTFRYQPCDPDARPYVTLITPFHNPGAVFHETARCVFAQSFQQWEWLIINDVSTDSESLAILETYRKRDPRVRVIDHDVNGGSSAARNTGFREARTAYVFQLDSDDLIEPSTVEKCVWYLESHPECSFVEGFSVGFGSDRYLWNKGFHQNEAFTADNLATIMAMIRKAAHARAGGYDETIRDGMEDWDFWLRCADRGMWGGTIPEYLDWYRRRDNHHEHWPDIDRGSRQQAFQQRMREKYPRLYEGQFPKIESSESEAYARISDALPFENRLGKGTPRLLMIVPWLRMGGADKFNLDLLTQLVRRGWEVTIATTLAGDHSWMPDFARYTPDLFALRHFLKPADHPRFLRYLIGSRRPDVVLVSNTELGYLLLPYLRAHCPEPAYVDYSHMEQEDWKNGGYPRYAVGAQPLLDLSGVTSEHLKRWMVERGAEPDRVEVCYINVDADTWRPQPEVRRRVRQAHGIPHDLPVILYAGRLCPQKQPKVFARVMRALARRNLSFRTLVAGDGPDEAWLKAFLRKNRLGGHVRMLGNLPNETVRELMSASDVFFLPSEWEGIALSIYEAMAMGLAIIGADVGGQRELVTPECGILLPRADEATEVEAYAAALARCLDDPETCRAMGERGRARVAAYFRLDAMGERMCALFDRALRLKTESPRVAVDRRLASEWATQALEYLRIAGLADRLWQEREQSPGGNGSPAPVEPEMLSDLRAQVELDFIEGSRTWRTVQRIQRNPLYRLTARLRYGPDWDAADPAEGPQVRLARIKGSRFYRVIRTVRASWCYRRYASRRYGSDFINRWA